VKITRRMLGAWLGRDFRAADAVDVAGSVILELEREDGKPPNIG
jgi:hypothetical protein